MSTLEERERSFNQFLSFMKKATRRIPSQYMLFPIAGEPNPIYRERVYCYELYHQLRVAVRNGFEYSLGGEVDKSRHPILSQFNLDKTKPDLLVHQPGTMDGNLVVMEVKACKAKPEQIEKDLRNMTSFVRNGQYLRAIYLVYSGTELDFSSFRKSALRRAQGLRRDQIDLNVIRLYWHSVAGKPAGEKHWQ